MAKVSIQNKTLTVEITGMGKLWALKSKLQIPLQHVGGATVDPGVA